MKNLTKIFTFLLAAVCLFNSCKNPASEMNIIFDADVIKYKATLILKSSTGEELPSNINVTVEGQDAASIYDFSGTKKIYAPAGIVTIGVTPKDVPTANKDLAFDVLITAPGYEPKRIPMTILFNQFQQIVNVTMLKTVAPSPASTVVIADAPLTNGTPAAPLTFTTPTSATVEETTTVTIPAGTQFKAANGTTLTGSTLTAQIININPDEPAALTLFPGGKLSADDVVLPGGNTGDAFFLPAGFTDIRMFIGGVEIKQFSTPITVSIQVDPEFMPQSTGTPVKAGDQLSIFSYQTETGRFTYEGVGTVAMVNGKPTVNFQTNHLTVFFIGDYIERPATCGIPQATFVAPWMNMGTEPMTVEIWNDTQTDRLAVETIIISNGKVEPLDGLPAGIPLKYRVINSTGQVLAQGGIADACSMGDFEIVLGAPTGPPVENISLLLNVNCPGKGQIIVPNFDLFYRPAESNGAFELLGTAEAGTLKTTLLKVGSSYDFRATWKNQVKVIDNRTITDLDQSTTVGENDFLGTKSPQYNKMLLIEACKDF
ncbi:hypothetical protein [Pedobacter faecalis]|uniref:hypothetical protein n=1 Tax=Pedobacter faecalis TaxID=3041495 RepID=UPI00254BCAE7|nr:hypothetical protein [Pedobacter sp. ELA7]